MRSWTYLTVAAAFSAPLAAQPGLYYPAPSPSSFTISKDVRYAVVDTTPLVMDVYRPAGADRRQPALVFYTTGTQRANPGYRAWASIVASKGFVGILADLRVAAGRDDFRTLLAHLVARAGDYGIDTSAIAAFGSSSNAGNVFPVVQDSAEKRVKAVVMYYGGATEVTQLRRDLAVLYIRAGLDRPFVNASIDTVVTRALAQNAPITVINNSGGHHSFESTDDDLVTRSLIDQTIDFLKRVTAPEYRADFAATVGYATAAAHVASRNFAGAAASYATLVARAPSDPRLRLSYGEALLASGQFATACDEFEKLKDKGLGPRDLGLPAANACLHTGDAEKAMAWLKSIPRQFLPVRVKDDPAFAALKERADFKALFPP